MNRILRLTFAAGALTALAACSTTQADKLGGAVTAPASDLNLVSAPIPEVLQAAQRAPYGVPGDGSCTTLVAQVRALDEVLGPDLDRPVAAGETGLLERGGDFAVDAVRRSAEGLVPFRGWIRKLSGAERYAKQVAAAITAGGVRRGFLKGLMQAGNCPAA